MFLTDILSDEDFYGNATPNPSNVREIYLDVDEFVKTTLKGGSTTVTWKAPEIPGLGETSLTVMGSWQERVQDTFADVDRTNAFTLTPLNPTFPLVSSTIFGNHRWTCGSGRRRWRRRYRDARDRGS